MKLSTSILVPYVHELLIAFILLIKLNPIHGLRVNQGGFYPGSFYSNQQAQFTTALEILGHDLQLVNDWPDPSTKLGQVSGVALDSTGAVLVFHRGPNVWDANTFSDREVYQAIGEPAIADPTILVFNETGELIDSWGQNFFFMPHGITVDQEDNVWVTDVALHQVFKFKAGDKQHPALVLGEKFVPGNDDFHFCKPSAVAVLSIGDFFVADGYCNTRIIKYAPDGTKILQWGRQHENSPFGFFIPHALALAEEKDLIFVADREHGRVASFCASNGSFVTNYRNWLVGGRIFSVAYSTIQGGRIFLVNGPGAGVPVRGYVIDLESGKLIQTFAPENDFSNPHELTVSPDGSKVYVAEIRPFRVYKFVDDTMGNTTSQVKMNITVPVKPTAIVEVSMNEDSSRQWMGGAAGGALGAAGAAIVIVSAVALLRARNRGRKGGRRRWEYGPGEFKLRRLLERRRFTRVHSDDSEDEPAPMLPARPPACA